jgi:peptidoglycan-associated lipoprotein
MLHRGLIISVVAAGLFVASCGQEEIPPSPPPPVEEGPNQDSIDAAAAAAAAAAATAAAEEERRRAEALAAAREALTAMVFFDYDMAEIRDDAASVLQPKVDVLRASPAVRLRIEGHADERGSSEYNLALGSRRAEAVRQYFANFGLDESRFEVRSYGEEQPRQMGSSEQSWAQNRRDEFVITAGGNQIQVPGGGQ